VATEENRPMTEREAGTELIMQLSEGQFLELVNVFKEENRNIIYIFLLKKACKKFKKTFAHYKKY
jgi:hypothetical protein